MTEDLMKEWQSIEHISPKQICHLTVCQKCSYEMNNQLRRMYRVRPQVNQWVQDFLNKSVDFMIEEREFIAAMETAEGIFKFLEEYELVHQDDAQSETYLNFKRKFSEENVREIIEEKRLKSQRFKLFQSTAPKEER